MRIKEFKSIKTELADLDEKTNTVVVYYSRFDVPDRVKDIVEKSAFNKTIMERGPKGSNEIWHLENHTKELWITKPTELISDGYGLKAVMGFPDTTRGRDTREGYKYGLFTHHSIGYSTIKEDATKDGYNHLKELFLWEGSHVLWPAHPDAITSMVDLKSYEPETVGDVDIMIKGIEGFCNNSSATDEVIIKMLNCTKILKDLLTDTTQPEASTVPDNGLMKALTTFNKNFKL